jgi:uncharacterized protein (UPF0332 family)/predicted nucleotidyltransferase
VESIVEEFVERVLGEHGDVMTSIVLVGSGARGELSPKSDVDVLVIADDTSEVLADESSVKALRDDLDRIAREVSGRLSIHFITITDFVERVSSLDPIIYNFLREGKPIFDVGFFTPWKKLLELGRIPRTKEAVEKLMESSKKKVVEAEATKAFIIGELCYDAIVKSTQAILMELDLGPRSPRELYRVVKEHLVKCGLLEKEQAEWLRKIVKLKKKIERGGIRGVEKEDVDEWIRRAKEYVGTIQASSWSSKRLRGR